MPRRIETVPIEKVVPHPDNSNEMNDRTRERIRRHIAESHRYPVVIVRSLESSVAFEALHAEGKYQCLDGQHRGEIIADIGLKTIDVDVWEGVTDQKALLLLATLNHGGDDNPIRRGQLIARLIKDMEEEPDHLELYLPETAGDIRRMAQLTPSEKKLVTFRAGEGGGTGRGARPQGGFPLEVFLPNRAAAEKVRAKINEWLKQNDPSRRTAYCEGLALMGLLGIRE